MSAPKHAKTTSKGRTYQHPVTGETAWSVTTLLDGGLPKRALVGWAARSVAEFAVANRRQLDAILESVTLQRTADGYRVVSDPTAVNAAIDYLKGSPYRHRERKKDLGTAVHAEVEAAILGTPRPEPPEDIAPHMTHFRRFEATYKPEWIASEMTVWNRTESYAGTLDWIATIGGKVVLGDTKTGKDIYPDVALQLAAYMHGEFALLPDGTEAPLPSFDGAVVLHLTETGYALRPVHVTDVAWKAFLYCREVFRWEDELSKSVLGEPLAGPDGVTWTFASVEGVAA